MTTLKDLDKIIKLYDSNRTDKTNKLINDFITGEYHTCPIDFETDVETKIRKELFNEIRIF